MECLALPILSTVSIRGASRGNLQYMDTRRICKLQKGIIYRAVIILHHCNMQNLCRFKTLTFKLEQWKHFKSDLLQNYQLSCSSTASLIWWHMWVKMCITPFPLTSLMSLFPTMVLNSLRSLIIPLRISAMRFLWWLLTSWIRDSSTSKATRCVCVQRA